MSPSQERPGATLPTEQIPAIRVARGTDANERAEDAGRDPLLDSVDTPREGADEVPDIVPSGRGDTSEPTRPRRSDEASVRLPARRDTSDPATDVEPSDAPSTWVGESEPPLVVSAPTPEPSLRPTGRRARVRRVTRTVRHLDPWSVFKMALICSFVLYAVVLTSGVLLWNVALSTGTIDNVERWFTQFGWETFELNGGEIYHNAWIGGLFAAVGLTGVVVLMATVFNLVSDIIGGVRVTVLEDEVVERTASSARRYVVQRPGGSPMAGAASAPDPSAWNRDGNPPQPTSRG